MARSDVLEAAKDEYEGKFKLFQLAWPGKTEEWYVAEVLKNEGHTPLTVAECITMSGELDTSLA